MMSKIANQLRLMINSVLWRNTILFFLFIVIILVVNRQLGGKLQQIKSEVDSIQESQHFSQDFLSNRKNYIFESGVKVNQYVSNFIARSVDRKTDSKVLYLKKKSIKNVKFYKSYLPVEVIEFDIGIQGRFMSTMALAEKLKGSPFLIIWKQFNFTMKNYPVGESRLVFYTFVKKG